MRILITNDDGISSKLILLLYSNLKKLGHDVIICAPDKNNSCISQAIRFWEYKDNHLTRVDDDKYSHPGTPADGINYYLREFNIKPDLVISGINIGLNGGVDIQYSGTIGAASEAINYDIPAIAISADKDATLETITFGLETILNTIFKHKLYSNEYIYSFNIPSEIRFNEIVVAPLNSLKENSKNVITKYDNCENISFSYYGSHISKYSDIYYLSKGVMTITPILIDRTYYKIMQNMPNFFDK